MSAMRLPTVTVHHAGGDFAGRGERMTINLSDYEADVEAYKLYVEDEPDDMTRGEIKANLDKLGLNYDGRAKTSDLLALLQSHNLPTSDPGDTDEVWNDSGTLKITQNAVD